MAIVKIKKELKSNVNYTELPKKQPEVLHGVSLNSLNNSNEEYHFEFGTSSSGMSNGKLKNETSIVSACVKTTISSFIKILIFFVIIYFSVKYFKKDVDLTWFNHSEYLIDDLFWNEFLRVGMIMGGSLLVICFMIKLFINGSIKRVFKKSYLNKVNMYIYYVYLSIVNVEFYIGVSVIYFLIINSAYDHLKNLQSDSKIVEGINIEIFEVFKYSVVVIVAIFIALNIIRGISIVYKNNKFILEEEV